MSLFTPENIGQPMEQPAQPTFQPQLSEKQTRELLKTIRTNQFLSEERKESLRQHASYYNIPFYEGEFDIVDALKHAGAGFFEGFTTFKLMEPADNEYEQIFRNLGHLAGFAPGIMATPLNLAAKATKLGALTSLTNVARALSDKSIPMMGAKILTKQAKKIVKPALAVASTGRAGATTDALSFLTGNQARHIMEGAFHLGSASAISSWQGGVDEMMSSFLHGGIAGAGFRAIGNLNIGATEEGSKFIRGIAGSLFMGLPATMRGATAPEQIYEYLLGAYFGKGEMPWRDAKAHKFIAKVSKRAETDPNLRKSMDPKLHPEFGELPKEVQPIVEKLALIKWGPPELRRMAQDVIAQINPKKLEEIPTEVDGFEVQLAKGPEGEQRLILKKGILDKYKSVIYSGAAEGPDRWFAKIGKEKGIPTIHYTFGADMADAQFAVGFKRPLEKSELEAANIHVAKASQELGKPMAGLSERQLNYLRRNWYQVAFTNAIYAVAPLETSGAKKHKIVQGGTGWTVEMAKTHKNTRDRIFVYDEPSSKWWKWNRSVGFFEPLKGLPPKPPRSWAGIGSRKATVNGQKAIQEFLDAKFPKGVKVAPTKEDLIEIEAAKKRGEEVLKPYLKELTKAYYTILKENEKLKRTH